MADIVPVHYLLLNNRRSDVVGFDQRDEAWDPCTSLPISAASVAALPAIAVSSFMTGNLGGQ